MTVAELIAELKEFNPDAIVLTNHAQIGYFSGNIDIMEFPVKQIDRTEGLFAFFDKGNDIEAVVIG